MAVPKFQEVMLPVLELLADNTQTNNGTLTVNDATELLAKKLELTEDDWGSIVSGGIPQFKNNVGWALSYLKMAGLTHRPQPVTYEITNNGRELLNTKPDYLDLNKLKEISPELRNRMEQNRRRQKERDKERKSQDNLEALATQESERERDPRDRINEAFEQLRQQLDAELMEHVLKLDFDGFEKLVINLMLKMGYGENENEAGKHVGRSGDGGIDGEINEDKLGLRKIVLQAKQFKPGNSVGPDLIQKFIGAMDTERVGQGVFFTTSSFTEGARKVSKNTSKAVRLVDGSELTELMRKYELGVRTEEDDDFRIQRLDKYYFSELTES